MEICDSSKNDDMYEIIKKMLDDGADPSLLDEKGNMALHYLLRSENKNLETMKLLLCHSKNNKNDNWKQKYLDFFKENNITLPPLSGDSYDWKNEYERISKYEHWQHFKKQTLGTEKKLCWFDCGMKELPKEIGNLNNLENLTLGENSLTGLPEEMEKMIKLRELYMYDNNLKKIPNVIFNLTNLEILALQSNQITEIPEKIDNLKKLKNLTIYKNKITKLPKQIASLEYLERLDVEENHELVEVAEEIGNLQKLREISISKKHISLMSKVMEKLPCLKKIEII